MNIYVSGLAQDVTEDDLRGLFAQFGSVDSAAVIKDKFTGLPRGFGFVEMASREEAQAAINALNGKDFKGKTLTVSEARPKTGGGGQRGGRGGGRGSFAGRGAQGGGGREKKGRWGGFNW